MPRELVFDRPPAWLSAGYLARVVIARRSGKPEPRAGAADRLRRHRRSGRAAVGARGGARSPATNRGAFFMPDVGDEVLVVFTNGDPRYPLVIGGLWNGAATAPADLQGGRQPLQGDPLEERHQASRSTISRARRRSSLETPGGQTVTLKDGPGSITMRRLERQQHRAWNRPASPSRPPSKVKVKAATVEVTAGMVNVDTAMAKFSGVVKCETLIATSVVSTSYTPGRGQHLVRSMRHHPHPRRRCPRHRRRRRRTPLILLQRSDDDFVDAMLEDLRTPPAARRSAGSSPRRATRHTSLKLFQPVQRQFHLAAGRSVVRYRRDAAHRSRQDRLRRAWCCGASARRRRVGSGPCEGWMRASGRLRGWVRVDQHSRCRRRPAGRRSRLARRPASPSIDLALSRFALEREDALLERARDPAVRRPARRLRRSEAARCFYGMVPTASSRDRRSARARSGRGARHDFGPRQAAFTTHLVQPLRGAA